MQSELQSAISLRCAGGDPADTLTSDKSATTSVYFVKFFSYLLSHLTDVATTERLSPEVSSGDLMQIKNLRTASFCRTSNNVAQ